MQTQQTPHGEPGHLNVYVRDHDRVVTGYGRHDRVVVTLPGTEGLYIRVDHKWNLGMPTHEQILAVARKEQGVRGRWAFSYAKQWADGSSTDFIFIPTERGPAIPPLEPHCGSWVVTRKSDGQVIGEFFHRRSVERFNPEKVLIETAAQYMGRLNRDPTANIHARKINF